MSRIGFINSGYPEIRNIINISKDYTYQKVRRFNVFLYCYKVLNLVAKSIPTLGKSNFKRNLRYKFLPLFLPLGIDVIHSFNEICYTRKKWIMTFETSVPRFDQIMKLHQGHEPGFESITENKEVKRALKRIARSNCKKIIALSSCSKKIQQDLLDRFPEFRVSIESKLTVLNPPQRIYVRNVEDKGVDYDGKLNFLFVGSAFFRKGGMEMFQAFKSFENDYDFNLTIVSSLKLESFAAHETTEDVLKARKFIKGNSKWITYYESLPNAEVLSIMKKSHVGVLPTWADSYGFVTLEYQACGCPLISTDIRALPETNPESVGWLIPVTKNKYGDALYSTEADRERMRTEIVEGLVVILKKLFSDRESVKIKAEECLKKIAKGHNPENYYKTLNSFYNS